MHSAWFRSTFITVLKFPQIKEGGNNFWWEPILQKFWIIWSLVLYFNFISFLERNSLSFIRFKCILHDSGVFLSESWNFYKLRRGRPNFWVELISQKVWIIWPPFLYLNFKSFRVQNFSSFIIFQCILDDSGVLFSESRNFFKLKRGDLISGANQFRRMTELFGPSFCSWILKVLLTQILRHSLDFNAFCVNQEYLYQSLEISTN